MTIEQYIAHIKDVIARIYKMYPDIDEDKSLTEVLSILRQLKFILHYAETGTSFKAGVIERANAVYNDMFTWYPVDDYELKNAIRTIYTDLMLNDYNVGRLTQKESGYLFDVIRKKDTYYSELFSPQSPDSTLKTNASRNNREIANYFYGDLYWSNYTELWEDHGIKNLQYFFLYNVFGYYTLASNFFGDPDDTEDGKLTADIHRIQDFYTTLEAEGTCMDINPVKIKEINGKTHLVDLHGKIVASEQH